MRVPLHELHAGLGARFVDFAGFEMPLQYSGILEEHRAVRTAAGLFDVSHMSNLWVRGEGAQRLLSDVLASDPARLKPGRAAYTVAMREDGSIIDDLIAYKFSESEFHVVPNAGMNQILTSWLTAHAPRDVAVEDVSRDYAIFALQGPRAREVLGAVLPEAADVKRFGFHELRFGKRKGLVSGTGYTGEDGVEIILPNAEGAEIFPRILKAGQGMQLRPCGLGARDTLRLEKGYCLAPHEFAGGRTPLEAGLEWTVHWDHAFVGKHALEVQRAEASHDRLVGLLVDGEGIPRQGYPILLDGAVAGTVTSGTMSPTLRRGIALGYVAPVRSAPGTQLAVEIRGRPVGARVTKLPFV